MHDRVSPAQVTASVSRAACAASASEPPLLETLTTALPQACQQGRARVFDTAALQLWLLVACQDERGLRDKPGVRADFYHTCYGLSGLSVAQHYGGCVVGNADENALAETDAALNVRPQCIARAVAFFSKEAPSP